MSSRMPTILAWASVGLVAFVVMVGAALAPGSGRFVLGVCAMLAIGSAYQSAVRDPAALTPALLLSVPLLMVLSFGALPAWLIGALGVCLLVAAELNALSWELREAGVADGVARGRLVGVVRLGGGGAVGAVAVAILSTVATPGGIAAVLLGAAAIVALSFMIFGSSFRTTGFTAGWPTASGDHRAPEHDRD